MSALVKVNSYVLAEFDYATIGDHEVERRARQAVVKIRELQRAAIVDIGRELIEMKELLPDGTFLKWLESSFGWSRRTAVNYMQVAAEFGSRWETVSQLPTAALYKLASPPTPPEVREAVLNLKPGQIVDVRGLQLAIDENKKIELRKKRRANHEALRDQQTDRHARIRADMERRRAEQAERRAAAERAAERLRLMLGAYFPEFCDLLGTVDRYEFSLVVEKLAEQSRASRTGGAE